MTAPTDYSAATGFDQLLGVEVVQISADRVVMSVPVRPELLQPWGLLHGGVHCSLIESVASVGAATWYGDAGTVVGVNNSTNFLRPVREGKLTYTGTPITRGRTQQLWLVEARLEGSDKLVAQGQVRLANLPGAKLPG